MPKVLLIALLIALAAGTQAHAGPALRVAVEPDAQSQPTIVVSGAGAEVTLATIRAALGPAQGLLEEGPAGVWLLRANLLIERGVTLALRGPEVAELRLRSEPGPAIASLFADEERPAEPQGEGYDRSRFVYLRTNSGSLTIDGVRVYAWDPGAGAVDAEPRDGRAYLLAKFDARLDIANAELGYLGFADGESYGVSWRDINATDSPAIRRRVTGTVVNSRFHHNYYGVYTYQASGMIFRGNQFDHNHSYGFDPHDYSVDFVVEDNTAFANGNHGFIISRGCTGFSFRRNTSYGNNNSDPTLRAHGFMLDAGSPTSPEPQASSSRNLLEANHAYDNEGYGLRILGSDDNIVRANHFERNHHGLSVELDSDGNTIEDNRIVASRSHGLVLRGAARTLVKGNSVSASGAHGIYLYDATVDNQLVANSVAGSGGNGIRANGPGVARNSWSANLIAGGGAPIAVTAGANGGIKPPTLAAPTPDGARGTAAPGTEVELFAIGPRGEPTILERVQPDGDGRFGVALAPGALGVMAVATDDDGNSSAASVKYLRQRVFLPLVVGAVTNE